MLKRCFYVSVLVGFWPIFFRPPTAHFIMTENRHHQYSFVMIMGTIMMLYMYLYCIWNINIVLIAVFPTIFYYLIILIYHNFCVYFCWCLFATTQTLLSTLFDASQRHFVCHCVWCLNDIVRTPEFYYSGESRGSGLVKNVFIFLSVIIHSRHLHNRDVGSASEDI